jgi:hypothetical protein
LLGIKIIITFLFSFKNTIFLDDDLTILGALLFISVIMLIVCYVKFTLLKDKNYSFNFIGLGDFFVLISTMVFAGLFSILVRPIFSQRYAFPMIGCLWLSVAVLLGNFIQMCQMNILMN